jgi:ribosomal protein S8
LSEHIANRNYNLLVENGLNIKEADLGIQFEEVTKTIFKHLGFNVDIDLKNKLNTAKDKVDIVLNEGGKEIVIIECKSVKEKGYNKYSAVSRQLKAYKKLAEKNDFTVKKMFVIAPAFSDDFVNECGLDYELNLSLISADTLFAVHSVYDEKSSKPLSISLLMRDVLIDKERVLKAMKR